MSTFQRVEVEPVVRGASAAGAVVVFRPEIGTTLQEGQPVADLHGGDVPDRLVLDAVVTGLERTLDQDPLLALRLLADIGLKALSSAVNDPATAVSVLDVAESLLRRAGRHELRDAKVLDGTGALRVVVPLPGWEEFLVTGVDDLLAGRPPPPPMVLRRAERLLRDLRDDLPPGRASALERRLRHVQRLLAEAPGPELTVVVDGSAGARPAPPAPPPRPG